MAFVKSNYALQKPPATARVSAALDRVHVRLPKEGEIEEVTRERQCQVMRYKIDRMSEGQNLRQLPFESIKRIYDAMVAEYAQEEINPS